MSLNVFKVLQEVGPAFHKRFSNCTAARVVGTAPRSRIWRRDDTMRSLRLRKASELLVDRGSQGQQGRLSGT